MNDLFLLLQKKIDSSSLSYILNEKEEYGPAKSFSTWDLSVQFQTNDKVWDLTRLENDDGKWDLSEEENSFLEKHNIKDVICFSYPPNEKQKTIEILNTILNEYSGFVAEDDDFNEDNLFSLEDFTQNYG